MFVSKSMTLKASSGSGEKITLITFILASWSARYRVTLLLYRKPSSQSSISVESRKTNDRKRRHCRPGGYYELQDLNPRFYSDDGTLQVDSSLCYWSKIICEASAKYHRPVPYHNEFYAWFKEAGFEDVTQYVFKSPSNPWPKDRTLKESGKFQLLAHLEGLEGISLGLLTRALEWKPEEVNILMAKIRPELKDKTIHSYQVQ